MSKKKLNGYTASGLLAYSTAASAGYILELPEFFKGLGFGLAISLMLFGMLSEKHDMTKIREFKRNIVAKLLG
jgi:hypothetical protein